MRRQQVRCGTRTGFLRHKSRDEEPCQPCREANAAYFRSYRAGHPASSEARARKAAQGRALTRLSREYPERFGALVAEELRDVS